MKPYHLLYFISSFALACSSPTEKTKRPVIDSIKANTEAAFQETDTAWYTDFIVLQKVLARSDKKGLKEFMSFPIMNAGNDIWHLVDVTGTMNIPSDKIKPFTESDYEKYHRMLFTLNLPPAIRRINAQELFKQDSAVIPGLVDDKGIRTDLEVKFDKYANRLTLRLITKSDEWKFVRFYHFNIKNGKISFHQLVVGG